MLATGPDQVTVDVLPPDITALLDPTATDGTDPTATADPSATDGSDGTATDGSDGTTTDTRMARPPNGSDGTTTETSDGTTTGTSVRTTTGSSGSGDTRTPRTRAIRPAPATRQELHHDPRRGPAKRALGVFSPGWGNSCLAPEWVMT